MHRLWVLVAVQAAIAAASLVVEIVAGRMLAPYVGMSLYTWTSVIAVVLAGFSAGHWLGGRLAEEIVYGEVWTGASNDLQRVTAIARAMITQFGMSDKLGTLAIGRRSSNPFLGRDYAEDRDYSEEVARMIDEEVRHIVDICYKRGHDLLMEHRQKLDDLVAALLERETLDRDEFLAVLAGEELPALDKKDQGTPAKIDAPPTESESKGKSVPPSGKLEPGTANG